MRSGWPEAAEPGRLRVVAAAGWRRLSARLPAGWTFSWALCIAVAATVGSSTATADWVPGSDSLSSFAVYGALLTGALALIRPLPWSVALPGTAVAGAVLAARAAGPSDLASSLTTLTAGDYLHAGAAFLLLLALLMWVSGGWLAWAVLRRRQPLPGLVPGGAVVATNVLNTDGQNGFAFLFVAATVALLLWTAYKRSVEDAVRRGLRLSSEARWDFWESGGVAALGLLTFGVLAPPLSTVDRTVDAQAGVIKAWSDVQLSLHHAIPSRGGPQAPRSTGFTDSVELGHPLNRNTTVVFTYKVRGSHGTPLYFRGLDIVATTDGEWTYLPSLQAVNTLPPGAAPPYGEQYQGTQSVTVNVTMERPPAGQDSVFFYPGELAKVNRTASVAQEFFPGPGLAAAQNALGEQPGSGDQGVVVCPGGSAGAAGCQTIPSDLNLYTIDRLSTARGTELVGPYTVTGSYSVATPDQLRGAGTAYPLWVQPYRSLVDWKAAVLASRRASAGPLPPYLAQGSVDRIAQLARQVTAGKTNPYDQAAAIELYLRSHFDYTLSPPAGPAGTDPLTYFLFQSKKGYCEYFATAMGDMLRSLGIPTRLVNGYGPGTFSGSGGKFTVRESDAHTWVEAYFPHYGWIPFEPTPDGTYFPIPRGAATCHVDSPVCDAIGALGAASTAKSKHFDDTLSVQESQNLQPVPPPSRPLDPWPWILAAAALLAAAATVVAVRFLSPRTPGAAWRRTRLLGRMAGLEDLPAETPLEFGRRLGAALPAVAGEARRFAEGFNLAAYAPPELALAGSEDVMAGWLKLRPALLRQAAARAARRR